jgi:dipeptidase
LQEELEMLKTILFRKSFRWLLSVLFFAAAASVVPVPLQTAQDLRPAEPEGCTSIQVGRLASEDGSVMTCHTCDGNYRQWLNIVPHAKHAADSKNKIYSGKMHTETPMDIRGILQTGEVPEVPETFAFLNTAYPCLNEHGLAIGETTIGGKRELQNPEGMFMIEELERLMLERCKTAREAIKLAGELIRQYGYGDDGECITIADAKEVWHFEVFGAGPIEKGGVWAALRIPDGHIGVSANIPRIGELNLKDPDHCMASDNVFQVARDMGWWDEKSGKPFKFWEAYSGRPPFSIREYYILSTLAPSLKLERNAPELPFSVKPDKKVSVRDILDMYRETYEGTDYDMTKNLLVPKGRNSQETVKSPVANPWMSRDMMMLLNSIKPGTIDPQRTIAISACSYATVLQLRGWLPPSVGAICWFSFDNPAQSARIPIFSGVTELPPGFDVCAQHKFRTDSAAWAFRRANRLASLRWGDTRKYVESAVKEFEEKAFADLPLLEKKVLEIMNSKTPDKEPMTVNQYLTKYTNDFARAAIQKYWELGDRFWGMFARGI